MGSRYEIGDKTIEICRDESCESPRAWDNLGMMVCFHNSYSLGDKTDLAAPMFANWQELRDHLVTKMDAAIVLPLYLLDHSGLAMRCTPFGDPWDSAQVGFIYATNAKLREEYGQKLTPAVRKRAERVLVGEVEVYSHWLEGECYEYSVYQKDICRTCKHVELQLLDSCSGFIGPDIKNNGLLDNILEPYKSAITTGKIKPTEAMQ